MLRHGRKRPRPSSFSLVSVLYARLAETAKGNDAEVEAGLGERLFTAFVAPFSAF